MAQDDTKFRIILMCHTIVKYLSKFFFQSSKKTRGTGGTEAKIGYKCWYKRIIAVPRRQFLVAQRGTNGVFTSFFANMAWHSQIRVDFISFFRNVLGTRDPFCVFENFFAKLFPYRVYKQL